MVDEAPDIGAALRDYLKDSTVLVDANHVGSANNIYVGMPSKNGTLFVPNYSNFIAIITGRGGPGNIGLGLYDERIDIFCYGEDERRCKRIAGAVRMYIEPQDIVRRTSFTRKSCNVYVLMLEGGPNTLTDPDIAYWPYTVLTYRVKYNSVPVT